MKILKNTSGMTGWIAAGFFLLFSFQVSAQEKNNPANKASTTASAPNNTGSATAPEKPKMVFMGAYDAGQPGVNIYKMFDPTEDVVCYVLMPEVVGRRQVEQDRWIYDGNSVGSISCLKVKLPVVTIPSNQTQKK